MAGDAAQLLAGFLVFTFGLGLRYDTGPGLEPAAAVVPEDAARVCPVNGSGP
ncbi:hypothetical protein GCM10010493_59230 [Streptomyces lavendulae subsp. grasserius]